MLELEADLSSFNKEHQQSYRLQHGPELDVSELAVYQSRQGCEYPAVWLLKTKQNTFHLCFLTLNLEMLLCCQRIDVELQSL